MPRRLVVPRTFAAGVALLAPLALAPAAAGQSTQYAGGKLDSASLPSRYVPTVGIALEPRGDRIALRFDSTIKCGRQTYPIAARRTVSYAAGRFAADGVSRFSFGRGRVVWRWKLDGEVAGEHAGGTLRVTGRRIRRSGEVRRCRAKASRPFRARILRAPGGPATRPAAGALLLGASEATIANGLRGPVVVRVSRDGLKAAARWTAAAPCGRGPREVFVNFTPATTIGSDARFERYERFRLRYADALVRYRVAFRGAFTADGAVGQLRLRTRVYDRSGRRLITRCDSGVRDWSALAADGSATTAPASTTAPGEPPATSSPAEPSQPDPEPGTPIDSPPGDWSMQWVSEPGDYVGQGENYAFAPPDEFSLQSTPSYVGFTVRRDSGYYTGGLFAPEGQTLRPGVRYSRETLDPAESGSAGLSFHAESRSCSGGVGSFLFDELQRGPDGAVTRASVTWEFRCSEGDPALRGSLAYAAG